MKNSYKKFSYYYDEIMARVDYNLWLEFVEPYINKGDSVLDVACGTGTFCSMLTLNGYKADGLDLSSEIIEIANEKKKINRMDINYKVSDMTKFKVDKKYDLVTCFFDSINFLKDISDVEKMLDCVAKALKKKGHFICDIFSRQMLKEYTYNEFHEDHDTFKIDWFTTKTNPRTLYHEITITEAGEKPFVEKYYEYYYDIKQIYHKDLKLIKISGDFNDELLPEDERIILVFEKM